MILLTRVEDKLAVLVLRQLLVDLEPALTGSSVRRVGCGRGGRHHDVQVLRVTRGQAVHIADEISTYTWVINVVVLRTRLVDSLYRETRELTAVKLWSVFVFQTNGGRKLTLESDGGAGLNSRDLGVARRGLHVRLVAAEFGAGHVGDLVDMLEKARRLITLKRIPDC